MASRTSPLDDDGFRAPKRRNRPGKSKPNSPARPRPSEVLTSPLSPIALLEAAPIDKFALDSVLKWKYVDEDGSSFGHHALTTNLGFYRRLL
jgi:hypothetical protein